MGDFLLCSTLLGSARSDRRSLYAAETALSITRAAPVVRIVRQSCDRALAGSSNEVCCSSGRRLVLQAN